MNLTSGVYILHKINFFPAADFLFVFPYSFFQQGRGKKWKKNYSALNFIHIILPLAYSFSFFLHQGGEKNGKMFSVLLIFTFLSQTTYFITPSLPPPSFSRVNFAEYKPRTILKSTEGVILFYIIWDVYQFIVVCPIPYDTNLIHY